MFKNDKKTTRLPTKPKRPKSSLPNAINTQRVEKIPHKTPMTVRPYVAKIFRTTL
jgi:hypothetical protein